MATLLHDAWRAVLPSSFDSKSQIIQYALLPHLRTVILCLIGCGWEFYRELTRPATCNAHLAWRTWLLIAPQTLLLIAYVLQFGIILRFHRRLKRVVDALALVLVPLAFIAATHSAFRTSISLCCCSDLLCPSSFPNKQPPSTNACSLFFSNCHWALLRKITHFTATMGLLSPLIALRLSVDCIHFQYQAARTHMTYFLDKIQRAR